jgi:hypothetical protein
MKYFMNKGICANAYYWKGCECNCSIEPHIGYDDPRLDVPLGDNADSLRKSYVEYVARKYICIYGCYDTSRCTDTDCKRAHCGHPALLDEDTARAFRKVYLEKKGSKMKKCSNGSAHNSLLCPYFHFPEDANETPPLRNSLRTSTTITTISSSSSSNDDIAMGSGGIVAVEEAEATSEQVLSFDSVSPIIVTAEKGVRNVTLPERLETPRSHLPLSDMQHVTSPSTASSWSQCITTCSKSLSDIMREEEELEAARLCTNPTGGCDRSLEATTAITRSACQRSSSSAAARHVSGVTATAEQPRNKAAMECLTAETATTLDTSISLPCEPCVEDANSTGEGWTSVKKKVKQHSRPSAEPRDVKLDRKSVV